MSEKSIRVGIDVGGTFTDAVAIDGGTMEIVAQSKVPTTHDAPQGVAKGVIDSLRSVLEEGNIDPESVVFIAHGTTQATNALLEGDVVKVGVVGMGKGLEAWRARSESTIEEIQLSESQTLETASVFLNTSRGFDEEEARDAIRELADAGAEAIVASEAYSVDDPRNERRVMELAHEMDLPACGSHQISKRYGLKARTRTAVVNASILPRMTRTADMTESSVKEAGITAPLMIMRGDGGAMTIDQMRSRPIQTLLSGPAAGVAGALMYERVSDGIFLEVGGTSTDISAVRNGKVEIDYAAVGGHRLYLTSLDVRTAGLAGGSMIRLRDGEIAEVGPRSAHIADLPYAVYADPDEIVDPELLIIRPQRDDPEEYVVIQTADGTKYALTLSGAANIAGVVDADDYAAGHVEAARRAFAPLADRLGQDLDDMAAEILNVAIQKVIPLVRELADKYEMEELDLVLVGGGGGAAAVVPYLAQELGHDHEIASSAEIIATVGVALAMVRDVVERTIPDPTEKDVIRVRREAEEAVIDMGAEPETVDVSVQIDKQRSLVRATATGALEMRMREFGETEIPPEERLEIAADSLGLDAQEVSKAAGTDHLDVYVGTREIKRFFGLFTERKQVVRVVDIEGIIRLRLDDVEIATTKCGSLSGELEEVVSKATEYTDAGRMVPDVFLLYGARIADLSGLSASKQIVAIAEEELRGIPDDRKVVIVADRRSG